MNKKNDLDTIMDLLEDYRVEVEYRDNTLTNNDRVDIAEQKLVSKLEEVLNSRT